MRGSPTYRVMAVLVSVIASGLAALLLAFTSWNPVMNTQRLAAPGMPPSLGDYPQFQATEQEKLSDFYNPPSPLPDLIPGSVLKSERIKDAPPGIAAYRVMYLSTGVDGSRVAVTAAFFDRADSGGPDGRPLAGFAHGTVGLGRYCGVSQDPFKRGLTGALFWESQIQALVDSGYAVIATDFQNMGAPGTPSYLVAESEAFSVLDSMRAALTQFPDRVDANQQLLIGHSQGGQASLAAAKYSPTYAPELAIRGTVSQAPGVIVGLPIVVKQLVKSTAGESASSRAEFISYLTRAWSATYPGELTADQILTPEGMAKLPLANKLCGTQLSKHYDQPLAAYVKSELPPSFLRLLNENVPVGPLPMPILFTQGLADTTIVPQFTIATYLATCQTGSVASLQQYPDVDHTGLLLTARTPVIDWMNDRVAGKPAPDTCTEMR
ncbi:MAG: alpha/beta fold hydrolase [Candidatus Nanopelagicales bacterium]|nr:alpha/beta fold hydrolase [Candidatus Nanopelagicales bacterium]